MVKPAKIACLDMNLQKARMHMGVQVLVTDPAELEKIRGREADIIKERIQKLLAAGANVVLTTKGIDDLSLKYFVEQGVLACRRVPIEDLRQALPACRPTFACRRLAALLHGLMGHLYRYCNLQADCDINGWDCGQHAGRPGRQREL